MNFVIPDMEKIVAAIGNNADEGYVYNSYGPEPYLKHVISSVITLRRYDRKRPVALFCSEKHAKIIQKNSLQKYFQKIEILSEGNQSVTGFKHNISNYMPFKKNLFLDSDILWCRNPDSLWLALKPYGFTVTGNQKADMFFGGHKGIGAVKDLLLNKRKKTLAKFGLTYLSRVQAGMIYASDKKLAETVGEKSKEYFSRNNETHFLSQRSEKGRHDETCEWSLAMAMSALKIQVFPWQNGLESPQLDYFSDYTIHDDLFNDVKCLYYSSKFKNDLKGLKNKTVRKLLFTLILLLPGRGDYLYVTPYCLHFGWLHQKDMLHKFSEKCWQKAIEREQILQA